MRPWPRPRLAGGDQDVLRLGLGRVPKASFSTPFSLTPSYALAHYWYGVYLTAMERFEEGFRRIKTGPGTGSALTDHKHGRGNVSVLTSARYEQSIEEYRKVLETDPTSRRPTCTSGWRMYRKGCSGKPSSSWSRR